MAGVKGVSGQKAKSCLSPGKKRATLFIRSPASGHPGPQTASPRTGPCELSKTSRPQSMRLKACQGLCVGDLFLHIKAQLLGDTDYFRDPSSINSSALCVLVATCIAITFRGQKLPVSPKALRFLHLQTMSKARREGTAAIARGLSRPRGPGALNVNNYPNP